MLTDRTRYRVTGTIFLLALAAIILPMLFDGDGLEPLELPPLPAAEIDVSTIDAVGDEVVPDFAATIAARDKMLAETDTEGYRVETGVRIGEPVLAAEHELLDMPANAWAVQVGSFAEHARAIALRNRLRADGYDALTSNMQTSMERSMEAPNEGSTEGSMERQDKLTRVAVGPLIDREDADRLRAELSDRYGFDGMVVRFGY